MSKPYPMNLIYCVFNIDTAEEPNKGVFLKDIEKRIEEKIRLTLTPREAKAIHLRYKKMLSFSEMSGEFKVTPEQVGKLVHKAERKLRHPSRSTYILLGEKKKFRDIKIYTLNEYPSLQNYIKKLVEFSIYWNKKYEPEVFNVSLNLLSHCYYPTMNGYYLGRKASIVYNNLSVSDVSNLAPILLSIGDDMCKEQLKDLMDCALYTMPDTPFFRFKGQYIEWQKSRPNPYLGFRWKTSLPPRKA